MCNYNGIRVSRDEFIRLKHLEKDLKHLNSLRPLASGFDYSDWPILKPKAGGSDFDVVDAHWEFVPPFVKNLADLKSIRNGIDPSSGTRRKAIPWLNARSENLFHNEAGKRSMWANSALNRRCLVLSSGFFEWRHYMPEFSSVDIAYPYYIDLPSHPYFFMAGIWTPWTDQGTGQTIDTFAIVTTKANDLMEQVHNKKKRMPTILPEDLAWEWIQNDLATDRILQIASHQFDTEEMFAYTIKKDFREEYKISNFDPITPFEFEELPGLI